MCEHEERERERERDKQEREVREQSMHACIILYTHGFILTAPESSKITNLHQKIDFDQYADFITVNSSHGRTLFYWYCTASRAGTFHVLAKYKIILFFFKVCDITE